MSSNSKVLFVDDSPEVIETLQLLFDDSGYDVSFVHSGEECIETLTKGFRGIIFLDVMMPGLDGWDTISKMIEKNLFDGNLICMLTATLDPTEKGFNYANYVLEYLVKPFTFDELVTVIERFNILLQKSIDPNSV